MRYKFPIAPSVALAFSLFTFFTAVIAINYWSAAKFDNDFSVFWRVAHQPLTAIYFWRGRFPFPYAPTMLLWISPLAYVPRWTGFAVWTVIGGGALALACRRYLRMPAIVLVLISPPVARGLFTGQVCAVLAALTIWACRTANRTTSGILFGLIASVKPQLVLMAPLLMILNRDWKAFWAAGLTFAATVAVSLLLFGPERWPEWIGSMGYFHHAIMDSSIVKVAITPAALAEHFGFAPLPFLLGGIVAGCVIVYLNRDAEPLQKAAAITTGSIIASPYALVYDLTAVMPLMALAVFEGRFLPALVMGTGFHPAPLLVSLWELVRSKISPAHLAREGRPLLSR